MWEKLVCHRHLLIDNKIDWKDFQIGKIIRLVRIMRIMRIFKLVRHFAGLQSLLYTLKQAYKELGLLFMLVAVAILTVCKYGLVRVPTEPYTVHTGII